MSAWRSPTTKFILIFLLFAALLFFSGCDYLLPKDDYQPSGQQFTLKPDIELKGIKSSDTLFHSAGAFTLELWIKLKSGSVPKYDTLPPGLFFLSQNEAKKDMIIVQNLPIAAGSEEKVHPLPVFGVQRRREIPSATEYRLGPLTDDLDIKRMVEILKKKRIEGRNVSLVQSAIYRITDGEELTQGLLDTLNSLPDEY